jgi:hypothetical protein
MGRQAAQAYTALYNQRRRLRFLCRISDRQTHFGMIGWSAGLKETLYWQPRAWVLRNGAMFSASDHTGCGDYWYHRQPMQQVAAENPLQPIAAAVNTETGSNWPSACRRSMWGPARGVDMTSATLVIWAALALGYSVWVIWVHRNDPRGRLDEED